MKTGEDVVKIIYGGGVQIEALNEGAGGHCIARWVSRYIRHATMQPALWQKLRAFSSKLLKCDQVTDNLSVSY